MYFYDINCACVGYNKKNNKRRTIRELKQRNLGVTNSNRLMLSREIIAVNCGRCK
jgi:hypothetical protein